MNMIHNRRKAEIEILSSGLGPRSGSENQAFDCSGSMSSSGNGTGLSGHPLICYLAGKIKNHLDLMIAPEPSAMDCSA